MVEQVSKPGENLRINGDRLWDTIHAIAEIGPGIAGGSNRQTVTDEDSEGRKLFQKWCEDAGMTMGVDQMGTMFFRREGTDPDALPADFTVTARAPDGAIMAVEHRNAPMMPS